MIRALLLVLLLAVAAAHGQTVYAVDRDQVNVRADATTQSARVAVLQRSAQVVEVKRAGQWMQVRMSDGATGWIHSQLLRGRLLVEGEGLRLRASPSATGTSVTMLFRGQEVARLGQQGSWTQVELLDGRKGWLATQYVRAKVDIDLDSERPREPTPLPPAVAVPVPASPEVPEDGPDAATILRDPYAEGLQHEAAGDHSLALDSFVEVLQADPDHVNALVHAAQAHRRMDEYDAAFDKLYRGLQLTGGRKDVYLILGELYRQRAKPDSAAKYQALFRGDTVPATSKGDADRAAGVEPAVVADSVASVVAASPLPQGTVIDELPTPRQPHTDEGLLFDTVWLPVGLAGIGLLALAAVGWWVVSTSAHRTRKGAALAADRGFDKALNEASHHASSGHATTEEEAELDRQIDTRWRELKESAAAFAPASPSGEGVDAILDQVDGLRQTLEGQDERARIYADVVRLQNMKIDAMTEEIRRLRRK